MRRFASPISLTCLALAFPLVTWLASYGPGDLSHSIALYAFGLFYFLTVPFLLLAACWTALIVVFCAGVMANLDPSLDHFR